MQTTRQRTLLASAVIAAISNATTTLADDKFWDGPVNNQWTNSANWFGGEPLSGDTAIFDGAGSVQRSLVVLGEDRVVLHMRVTGVPTSGPYQFVSEGGLLTALGVHVENGAGSIAFEGFRVNTNTLQVDGNATLNLTDANTQVQADAVNVSGRINWAAGSIANFAGGAINVNNGLLVVRAGGRGLGNGVTLNVHNGGLFDSDSYFDIGSSLDAGNGPVGTLSVSGTGSSFTQTAGLTPAWGHNPNDAAQVDFQDEGIGSLASGVLIATNGGTAFVNVLSGATLSVGGVMQVGGSLMNRPGPGRFDAGGGSNQSSAAGSISGFINVDGGQLDTNDAFFGGGAIVSLSSGGMQFGGDATFSTGSTFNWSGGTWTVASGKTLAFDGGAGSFTMTNAGLGLSNGSTLRITNGGSLETVRYFDIGSGGIGGGATGTMLVDARSRFRAAAGPGDFTDWGRNSGNSATVTFSNGGVGSFNAGLAIGRDGGAATIDIQSTAQLNTASLLAGRESSGASNGVSIQVNNARLNVAGAANFHTGATLNLQNNGSINFGGNTTFSSGSKFNWFGGFFSTAPGTTLAFEGGTGSFSDPTSSDYTLSNNSTLRIAAGGTLETNGYFDIAKNSLGAATGTMLVTGPGSRFTSTSVDAESEWARFPGNVATVTFSDFGVGSYNAGLTVGFQQGTALVNVQSSAQLNTASLIAGSVGAPANVQINVNNAHLNVVGNSLFRRGATLNLQNSGSINFGGSATFSTGSTFNWSGGTWSNAATLAFDGGAGSFTVPGGGNAGGHGLASGSTLRITNGGTISTNSYFDIGNTSTGGTTGTMIVQDPGSSITSTASSSFPTNWGRAGGDIAFATFANSGVGSYNGGLRMGSEGGLALVNLSTSARLAMTSLLAGADGANPGDGVAINVNSATLAVTGNATLRKNVNVTYSSGSIGIGGMLQTQSNAQINLTTGGNKVLRTGGLVIDGFSKIDLADNDMIVGALTPKSTIESYIVSARNGGGWDGTFGITSTAAKSSIPKNKTLGVLSGAEYSSVGGTGLFSGQPYVATNTLVKFTWYGDTDFNGVVNFDDYGRADAGFNFGRTGWLNGDFDGSGGVNFDDYGLIDLAFNTQGGTVLRASQFLDGSDRSMNGMTGDGLAMVVQHFNEFGQSYASSFLTAVPEPSAIALLAPIGGMFGRRRRCNS